MEYGIKLAICITMYYVIKQTGGIYGCNDNNKYKNKHRNKKGG